MSCENCEESAYVIDKLAKPLTRYSMESYIQGWHERHEMAPDPDGQWYAKAEADARIAALEAEVERLRADAERYRWLKQNNIIRVFPISSGKMRRDGSRILADTKDWLPGDFTYVIDGVTKDVDAAIDAARSAP